MPNYVSSWVSLNYGRLYEFDQMTLAALELTAEALHTEVVNSQRMPFDARAHTAAFVVTLTLNGA